MDKLGRISSALKIPNCREKICPKAVRGGCPPILGTRYMLEYLSQRPDSTPPVDIAITSQPIFAAASAADIVSSVLPE